MLIGIGIGIAIGYVVGILIAKRWLDKMQNEVDYLTAFYKDNYCFAGKCRLCKRAFKAFSCMTKKEMED
jgi:hypothetical protein